MKAGLAFAVPLAAALAQLTLTNAASAQNYYRAGKVSLSIERAFGIHHVSNHYDPEVGADRSDASTSVGLGWHEPLSAFHSARIAIDGFVTDRLSLGGAFGAFWHSGDNETDGFILAPRIGYVIPISRSFSFWPRGGVSYARVGDRTLFGFTAEAMFVASPSPDWHILFGPTMDVAPFGRSDPNTDWTQIAISFPTVGIMGTF
jgi:hypothetical protein